MNALPPKMNVPLLDIRPDLEPIKDEIKTALSDVVDSMAFCLGPKVQQMEAEMATYIGCKHAFGVSSGTDALLLALMSLGVGPGDQVVTTPFSFFATAGVISRTGATPVFVDIDPATFNLDPKKLTHFLENASADQVTKIKAIIPVHLYGQCADMKAIGDIAKKYKMAVVEDAAQAIGSEYPAPDGVKKAGTLGDIGCFSFYPSKNLGAMGDAGLVTTNDEALAERLQMLRVHGGKERYFHDEVGGNFRMDGFQGAVISIKLKHLESWHKARRKNADTYEKLFQENDITEVVLPPAVYKSPEVTNYHIYNQFVVRAKNRDALKAHLTENGIGTDIYYPVPFHKQKCFASLGYKDGDFPEAEKAAAETLALPIFPSLTEDMMRYVVAQIKAFYV